MFQRARNGAQKSARKSTRLDIGVKVQIKDASQRCKTWDFANLQDNKSRHQIQKNARQRCITYETYRKRRHMTRSKVYDWQTKDLRCKTYGQIQNSKLKEEASIAGSRLISGNEVGMRKLKMQNKSRLR